MKTLRILAGVFLLTTGLRGQQLIFPTAPPAPIATALGTTGATAYYFWVTAHYPWGISVPNGPGVVLNGNATLTGVNLINVTWSSIPSAISYDLLRTSSAVAPTAGCNCARVITTTATSYNDIGAPLLTYTVATPGVIFPDASSQSTAAAGTTGGPTIIKLAEIDDTANSLAVEKIVGVASAVNQITLTSAATGNPPTVTSTGTDTNIDLSLAGKGTGVAKIAGAVRVADLSITTADLNSPANNVIVAAVAGRTLQVVGFFLQAIGGNTATCTDVRISDTAGSPVDVATEVIAGLVQNQGITESSSVTNLTFGAGWGTTLTASQGIQIRKTGGACATATSFYVRVYYRIA